MGDASRHWHPGLGGDQKIQRLKDYPLISILAVRSLAHPKAKPDVEGVDWAWDHLFELDDAERFVSLAKAIFSDWEPGGDVGRVWVDRMLGGKSRAEADSFWESDRMERIAAFRRADRLFWQAIIDELKTLRADGELSPEGLSVE